MKSASHPTLSTVSRLLAFAAFVAALPLVPSSSQAATTWNTTTGTWDVTTNWDTSAIPTSLDDVIISPASTSTITMGTDSANSITFGGAGATTLSGGTSLTLGAGGITKTGAGAVTISTPVILGAAQTWTNNSASALTVSGTVTNGGFGLTLDGTGATTASGIISGTGGLTKTGTGTLSLQGVNTFTGGLVIKAGTVVGSVAAINNNAMFGAGTITIGDSVVGANATLNEAGFGNIFKMRLPSPADPEHARSSAPATTPAKSRFLPASSRSTMT